MQHGGFRWLKVETTKQTRLCDYSRFLRVSVIIPDFFLSAILFNTSRERRSILWCDFLTYQIELIMRDDPLPRSSSILRISINHDEFILFVKLVVGYLSGLGRNNLTDNTWNDHLRMITIYRTIILFFSQRSIFSEIFSRNYWHTFGQEF